MYHLIDSSPVGQFPHIQVINVQVGHDFPARAGHIVSHFFFRMICIDSIKLQSALAAEVHRLVKQFPSRTVHKTSKCRSVCNCFRVAMAKGISFPIRGYLCSTIVPSKSIAILIS